MSEIDKCELIYNDGRCFASQRQGVGYSCHKSDYCKYNSNCYYKQLQQSKAESESLQSLNDFNVQKIETLEVENEELKKKIDYCFEENSLNYDRFCDICVAKDTCNGNCCYNQIKEIFGYEI